MVTILHIDASINGENSASRAFLLSFVVWLVCPAAEAVVIGAPMYNITLPSQLKAWIDRILVAGKTFRYTETGPEGLAGGKRVIVGLARGGFYAANSPAASL